jgi:hypothetical protein
MKRRAILELVCRFRKLRDAARKTMNLCAEQSEINEFCAMADSYGHAAQMSMYLLNR